ncbi:MAG: hypothetical protein N3A54_02525 [Patescibacteria group bacterium]|nr:hypothetical protein [Patescibacteria group bacterium]
MSNVSLQNKDNDYKLSNRQLSLLRQVGIVVIANGVLRNEKREFCFQFPFVSKETDMYEEGLPYTHLFFLPVVFPKPILQKKIEKMMDQYMEKIERIKNELFT